MFDIHKSLQALKGQADWVGLRRYQEKNNTHFVRNGKLEINTSERDHGVMVEVLVDGHFGYAGTTDLSTEGLQAAFSRAKQASTMAARYKAAHFTEAQRPAARGHYQSPHEQKPDSLTVAEIVDGLLACSKTLKASEKIVSTSAMAMLVDTEIEYLSSNGSEWQQKFHMLGTDLSATAQDDKDSQTRTNNGSLSHCYQVGREAFQLQDLEARSQRIGQEALELLAAENCPEGSMDLLLAPDQMMLQIHESIGHPLELDRILGDERNYAGWSFIKQENFGSLQYGAKLLNVVFDPTQKGEFASYAFDDIGNPATREFLIHEGVLVRGLGSLESQHRSGLKGVANARSASWNRAPIDRMANINIVPGKSSLEEMIGSVKKGVFMQSNRSWSIDDYRNKFQFGCEYGQLIEDGRLTRIVKNPNYRGKTLQFWNSLKAVGTADAYRTYGTPYCGKGEPSQVIRVGHGSPPCLFQGIEVFGGVA